MYFSDGLSPEVCDIADFVDFFDNLLGVSEMNKEQEKRLALVGKVYLLTAMKLMKEKNETDHRFRVIVASGMKATIKKCEERKMQ